ADPAPRLPPAPGAPRADADSAGTRRTCTRGAGAWAAAPDSPRGPRRCAQSAGASAEGDRAVSHRGRRPAREGPGPAARHHHEGAGAAAQGDPGAARGRPGRPAAPGASRRPLRGEAGAEADAEAGGTGRGGPQAPPAARPAARAAENHRRTPEGSRAQGPHRGAVEEVTEPLPGPPAPPQAAPVRPEQETDHDSAWDEGAGADRARPGRPAAADDRGTGPGTA